MNIDVKTSRKIKTMQKRVDFISRGIKNANDTEKKLMKGSKPMNSQPLDMNMRGMPFQNMQGMNPNHVGMMQMGGQHPINTMEMRMNPQMGQQMNQQMNPQGPRMMNPAQMQGMAPPMGDPTADTKMKIAKIIKDK